MGVTRRLMLAMLAATGFAARGAGASTKDIVRRRLPGGNDWRWAVDYGPATRPIAARSCDLLILEPDHARAVAPLRGPDATVLGYISLGEVAESRAVFPALVKAGALRQRNPHWPEARYADLRHARWRAEVVDRIVPAILAKGYDGIFIDTLDNAEAMERADPAGNAGMIAAAASLVAAIRQRFPSITIVMNRGYALLPGAAADVDGVLGEAMASRWNFATKRYDRLVDSDWDWQATRLRAARAKNPALALMTLDYWDPADSKGVAALYARERAAGFVPYVSVLALDRIVPEPGR